MKSTTHTHTHIYPPPQKFLLFLPFFFRSIFLWPLCYQHHFADNFFSRAPSFPLYTHTHMYYYYQLYTTSKYFFLLLLPFLFLSPSAIRGTRERERAAKIRERMRLFYYWREFHPADRGVQVRVIEKKKKESLSDWLTCLSAKHRKNKEGGK